MNGRRMLSVVLALALAAGMWAAMPGAARAATGSASIGAHFIADLNVDDSGTNWTWTASTATLTLTDYNGGGIDLVVDTTDTVTVYVVGTVTMAQRLLCYGNLAITGSTGSSLNVDVSSYGIPAISANTVTIDTITVNASTASNISSCVLTQNGGFAMSSGALNMSATGDMSYGVQVNGGDIDISGTAQVKTAPSVTAGGLYASGDINISGSAVVDIVSTGDIAIGSGSALSISGGNVTAKTEDTVYRRALAAGSGGVNVTGGTVITGTDTPVIGGGGIVGGLTVNGAGADVTVNGEIQGGLTATNGTVKMNGGIATGGLTANGAGANVSVTGNVNGNTTVSAGSVDISGDAYHDLTVSGGTVVVGGFVGGDLTVLDGTVGVVGDVGDLTVSGGIVTTGTIYGTTTHTGGTLNGAPPAPGTVATITAGTLAGQGVTGDFAGGANIAASSALTVMIPNADATNAALLLTKGNAGATIKYVAQNAQPADDTAYATTYSGPDTITVADGNIIWLMVTASDGTTKRYYKLTVTVTPPGVYTITFDANGGAVTPVLALTEPDGKLATLPTPTRSGSYTFDGWYTDATGGTLVTTDTVFTAYSTIYAHWTFTGSVPPGDTPAGGGSPGGTYWPPFVTPVISSVTATPKSGGAALSINTASGGYGQTYQWQVQQQSGTWTDIPGATSANFEYTGLTPGQSYTVRCIVRNASGGSMVSKEIAFTAGGAVEQAKPATTFPAIGKSIGKNVNIRPADNIWNWPFGKAQKGDELTALGYANNFYMIAWGNAAGFAYISADYVDVTFGAPIEAKITGTVYAQTQMSTAKKYRALTLKDGDSVQIVGRYGKWWVVEIGGKTYYIQNGKNIAPKQAG